MRLLVDLNVVLDVLFDRAPHVRDAARLWAAIEEGRVAGVLAAHGVTTIYYLARRERGSAFARRVVEDLLSVFRVAPVGATALRRAMSLEMADFEDAVCAACAEEARCDAVVTRDPKGFRKAPVRVLTVAAALAAG